MSGPGESVRGKWNVVRGRLRAAGDEAVAERCRQIAPGVRVVLGIRVPVLREMVRAFSTEAKGLVVDDAAAMADLALASACREEILFASFLLARFRTKLGPVHWQRVDRWIESIDNWEACDQLATGVAGEMIARAPEPRREAMVKDLERWARNANPWRRRFAAATTTALNQKGRKDAEPALRVCRRLMNEPDRGVQKAVGWALREATKSDAAAVFALLREHAKTMPRSLLRESAEKLPTALRRELGVG